MEKLEEYRAKIDALDEELIRVLAARFEIVDAVGHLKARENVSVVQPERAEAVKERAARMAADKGIDPDFIRAFYDLMIAHAHDREDRIKDEHATA